MRIDIKIAQYRQVSIKIERILELEISLDNNNDKNEIERILREIFSNFKRLIEICDIHEIPTNSLLTLDDNINITNKLETILNFQKIINPTDLVNKIYIYINNTNIDHNIQLIFEVNNLFIRNFNIFKCEIENKKIKDEIKMEKFKYETVNKKQLDHALVAIILTTLLTIVDIILTIVTK